MYICQALILTQRLININWAKLSFSLDKNNPGDLLKANKGHICLYKSLKRIYKVNFH